MGSVFTWPCYLQSWIHRQFPFQKCASQSTPPVPKNAEDKHDSAHGGSPKAFAQIALPWEDFEGGRAEPPRVRWLMEGAGHCGLFAQLPAGSGRSRGGFPRVCPQASPCGPGESPRRARPRRGRGGWGGRPSCRATGRAGQWIPRPKWRAVHFLEDACCGQGLAFCTLAPGLMGVTWCVRDADTPEGTGTAACSPSLQTSRCAPLSFFPGPEVRV